MTASCLGYTHHATCLLIGPAGVLIRGEPGAGKTSLALALVDHLEMRGRFARLVADDRVHLSARHGRLIARVPEALAGLVERRGLGVVQIAHEAAAVIALVVDIGPDGPLERMPPLESRRIAMDGVEIPRIAVPPHHPQAISLVMASLGTESAA